MSNPHIGSSLDDFLAKEGLLEEATEHAIKRVLAWRIEQEMKARADQDRHGQADGDEPRSARPPARPDEQFRDPATPCTGPPPDCPDARRGHH